MQNLGEAGAESAPVPGAVLWWEQQEDPLPGCPCPGALRLPGLCSVRSWVLMEITNGDDRSAIAVMGGLFLREGW